MPVGYTGGAVWASSPAVGPATDTLYVGTGNNYTAPAGVCTRPAQTGCTAPSADDHVDSLLNIDITTGGVRWAVRTSDGELWRQACNTAPADCGPDGKRIYIANANGAHKPWTLPSGRVEAGGGWTALDAATGRIV